MNRLKSKVDKLDVDNLKPVPTNLKKINDVIEKEVVKNGMYDELIKKFNAIDTSKLVKKHIIVLRSRILKIKYLVLLT